MTYPRTLPLLAQKARTLTPHRGLPTSSTKFPTFPQKKDLSVGRVSIRPQKNNCPPLLCVKIHDNDPHGGGVILATEIPSVKDPKEWLSIGIIKLLDSLYYNNQDKAPEADINAIREIIQKYNKNQDSNKK